MKPSQIRMLLVMPDDLWGQMLSEQLKQDGFAPLAIVAPSSMLLGFYQKIQLTFVIFDLDAYGEDGLDLCQEMRYLHPGIKIVLVTENEQAIPLATLQIGVAGCIRRDFPLAEWSGVLTYILKGGATFSRNLLEVYFAQARFKTERQTKVILGQLQIDLTRRLVMWAGKRICLTPREFALLACLAKNTDQVVTFDQLLDEAWSYDAETGDPTQVRHYIARLRQKLADIVPMKIIVTERGIGYRLSSTALNKEKAWLQQPIAENSAVPVAVSATWLRQEHVDTLVDHLQRFNNPARYAIEGKKRLAEQWSTHEQIHTLVDHGIVHHEAVYTLEEWWFHLEPLGNFLASAIHFL